MAASKKTAKATPPAKPKPQGKTQRWMAAHLDVKQQRVSQFVTEGIFPALPDGTLDPDVCRVIYIRWLRDESRKSTASAQTSRAQEMRAREIELRIAKEENRLGSIDEFDAIVGDILGAYRAELASVPAAVTRDLELRAVIAKYLNDAIGRAKARFQKVVDDLRAGRDVFLGPEDSDT